jgi:hypothetical protein
MGSFKLPDNLIGREVERLFSEISRQRGSLRMSPVTGVSFVYAVEPIKPQKVHAYRALLAQAWFALNGPADAQPLPVDQTDWSTLKYSRGPVYFFTTQFARSMEPKYDIKEHPAFDDYVSGVLWEHDNNIPNCKLAFTADQLAQLRERFPPRKIEGLHCFCWSQPKRKKQTKNKRRAA